MSFWQNSLSSSSEVRLAPPQNVIVVARKASQNENIKHIEQSRGMEQKVSISELQRLEFKQAFEEFDKVRS